MYKQIFDGKEELGRDKLFNFWKRYLEKPERNNQKRNDWTS